MIYPCGSTVRDAVPPDEDPAGTPITSFADLLAASPPERFNNNPIIAHDVTYTNLAPGGIITDPNDNDRFILYVGGFQGNSRSNALISAYSGDKDTPWDLTSEGVVIDQGTGTDEDDNGANFGSVIQVSSTIYYFYVGIDGTGNGSETIMYATSTDGLTFTKQGQIITPDGVNEFNLTDPTVRKFGSTYYMYVTGKNVSGLPVSIILYTSSDLISWTRQGVLVSLGSSTEFDGKYIEGCEVIQTGVSEFVMFYTCASNSNLWSVGVALSSDADGPFVKETLPFFEHGPAGVDGNVVAVPTIFELRPDEWYFFYQGSTAFQPTGIWDVCLAKFTATPDDWPLGYIKNRGSWTGGVHFDTQTWVIPGGGTRAIRALDNTGFASVFVEHPTDVTPSATSSYKVTLLPLAVSGTNFIAGFYVYEGTTQVTGIYIGGGQIKHLRSVGWTNIQAAGAGTTYVIEIVLTSTSTYNVIINGSTVVTGAAPFNNIVTKANKLRLEKSDASTTIVYFSHIIMKNSGVETTIDYGQ